MLKNKAFPFKFFQGNADVVKILINNNAHRNVKDAAGKSAVGANENGHQNINKVLYERLRVSLEGKILYKQLSSEAIIAPKIRSIS